MYHEKRCNPEPFIAVAATVIFLLLSAGIVLSAGRTERRLPDTFAVIAPPTPTVTVVVESAAPAASSRPYTQEDIDMLCRMVWGEARGETETEQAATVWCVLNRVDDARFANTISEVVSAPYQFTGYRGSNPITNEIAAVVEDVLMRWESEKITGSTDTGRVLPRGYVYFYGKDGDNHFTEEHRKGRPYDFTGKYTPYND